MGRPPWDKRTYGETAEKKIRLNRTLRVAGGVIIFVVIVL